MNNVIIFSVLGVLLCAISGCDSESDTPVAEETSVILDDPDQCPVPDDSDFAVQLFTEPDRQWFCSVSNANIGATDEIYFSRNGMAEMARFGEVFWNRSLQEQLINVASPFVLPFAISNIFSANTVLTFDLVNESGEVEAYDCVLVGREVQAPELM